MAKRGRPVSVWTPEHLEKVKQEMREYTDKKQIPSMAGFAYEYDYSREQLYQQEELSYSIKRMMNKKEAQLQELGLMNAVNPTMAVFSLKQLGWKDKQEIEHSGTAAEAVNAFFKNNIEEE